MARTLNGTGIRHFISFESQDVYVDFVRQFARDESALLTAVECYPEEDYGEHYFLGTFESDELIDESDELTKEYERADGVIVASWNVDQG